RAGCERERTGIRQSQTARILQLSAETDRKGCTGCPRCRWCEDRLRERSVVAPRSGNRNRGARRNGKGCRLSSGIDWLIETKDHIVGIRRNIRGARGNISADKCRAVVHSGKTRGEAVA